MVESPFIWRARRADCQHRLICFPHAGGGAGAYSDWAQELPSEIEVTAVQLPGRQNRLFEDPATEVGPLIRDLLKALRPLLDRPFSLFGHSCGSLLAYEVARTLQAKGGPRPAHLFLSGESSPEAAKGRPKLHELSEEDFRRQVLHLGGFDEEIMDDEEALEALLPPVIADFRLWERHRSVVGPRLEVPVTVLGGDDDERASVPALDAWRDVTNAPFDKHVYPGGHFFLFEPGPRAEVLEVITRALLGSA